MLLKFNSADLLFILNNINLYKSIKLKDMLDKTIHL